MVPISVAAYPPLPAVIAPVCLKNSCHLCLQISKCQKSLWILPDYVSSWICWCMDVTQVILIIHEMQHIFRWMFSMGFSEHVHVSLFFAHRTSHQEYSLEIQRKSSGFHNNFNRILQRNVNPKKERNGHELARIPLYFPTCVWLMNHFDCLLPYSPVVFCR